MRLVYFSSIMIALSTAPLAEVFHVPANHHTIQAGIDAASSGDQVIVAPGTYTWADEGTGFEDEFSGWSLIKMKSGVYLTSATGEASCVTIDAQQQGRVFFCDEVDSSASIVGFTITGGSAAGGGGIKCNTSSPQIRNSRFFGNFASVLGGGVYCLESSNPTVTNCTFDHNTVNVDGGGIACLSSSPTLIVCSFSNNIAGTSGGGVHCSSSNLQILSCSFSNNSAGTAGGGIVCYSSSVAVIDCTSIGNSAIYGGGLYSYSSNFSVTGCTIVENAADDGGGIRFYDTPNATISNCIVAFNASGGAVSCYDSYPILSCCDVFGNVDGDWTSCIVDQYGESGNFSEDPLFCDAMTADFTLQGDSPCAPEHNECSVLIGAWPVGCSVCTENATWSIVKARY